MASGVGLIIFLLVVGVGDEGENAEGELDLEFKFVLGDNAELEFSNIPVEDVKVALRSFEEVGSELEIGALEVTLLEAGEVKFKLFVETLRDAFLFI